MMKRLLTPLLFSALLLLACSSTTSNVRADSLHTLTYDGLERTYILHVPPSYNELHPVPLVISLHGGGGNAGHQRRVSDFNRLADDKGFIVVYPNGTGQRQDAILTWNGGACCGYAMTNNVDDVGFIRALIAELSNAYAIDPKRIYVTGISNGGIMAYRLACEASDVIAAIAPVAGTLNYKPCQPTHPVAVLHIHGTDDTHLPYNGGVGSDSRVGVNFASVQESVGFWTAFNGCDPQPQTTSLRRHPASGLERMSRWSSGRTVHHHWRQTRLARQRRPAWVGGDEPTQSISASDVIWDFFAAHPRP
jgi:polyhydroxybutyrate depolymerase